MSEHEKTEVGAKLVLDDHASEAAEKLKEGFEHISERVHEAQHEMTGFAKQALATAAGFEITRGLDSVKEFAEEIFNAAKGDEDEIKSLQGLLAMTDKTGASFEDLREKATELHENLEGMAIQLGTTADAASDAFAMIAERSNKGTDEVKELVGQMIMAGRAVPGGLGKIAAAYRDLESGIVRPRNEIVLLMKQTGIAGGSVREIAKGMSHLMQTNPAKAFELANAAIGRMSDKMKDAPLTFDAIVDSLKGVREQIFETTGQPMLRAIVGPLTQLRNYLVTNQEKLQEYAKVLGEKVGEWVTEAASKVEKGFEWVQTHAQEIEDAIKSGAEMLRQVVEFLLAHRTEIRDVMLAKAGAGLLEKGAGALQGGIGLAKGAAGMMQGGSELLGIEASSAGALASLGALAAGIAGLAATAWAAKTIYEDVSKFSDDDSQARLEALKRATEAGDIAHDTLIQWRDALVTVHPEMLTMIDHLVQMGDAARKAHDDQAKDAHSVGEQLKGAQGNKAAVQMFHDVFARMKAAHNEAQMKYLAGVLSANQTLVDAMHKAGVDISDIGDELTKSYAGTRPDDATAAAEIQRIIEENKKKVAPVSSNLFDFRGSHFQITQDFRDQDPDRIILQFQRDLGRVAAAQTQSRLARGHGL